ncbi:MAG: hypothetical protein P8129_22710 [Anaerolineae bacterium]
MSAERIVLIVVGTALIVLVVAIAAFSLGVYVGVHGWTAEAPAVAGPGQRPPAVAPAAAQGAQPAAGQAAPVAGQPGQSDQSAGPQAQPGPQPQLVGRVRSRSGETITLETAQGPRLFQLGPDVQVSQAVEGQAEAPATLEQVQPGRRLAVWGQFATDGGGRLIARRLVLLPLPAQP